MSNDVKTYTFGLEYPDAVPTTRREAGVELDTLAREIQSTTRVAYGVALDMACEERADLKRVYALDLTPTHARYAPPTAAKFENPRGEVDRRVRARIHEEGGDATTDYKKALDAVLAADADLKSAYAAS